MMHPSYLPPVRAQRAARYLAEGTGFARRYGATADGQVAVLPQLDGDGYETWVSGIDPETGAPRGRVRADEHALRFAEVVVNGPKSWSIAAELHPDIAAAYEAAQDRAARQIVAWLGRHASTRVGPRGGQVSTPVERIEAVAVRHYTSSAGDPHRHLHLQVNARVYAEGRWRGIDSVAVRDSIGAVQGIGHAAVMGDPALRQVLATHGFTLDPGTGEVVELAGYVQPFSKRAEQVSTQVEGYEAGWRAAHPTGEPGPALRRSWDARAWAEHRPAKAPAGGVEPAQVMHQRWIDELAGLGYRPAARPAALDPLPVGRVDRQAAAAEVLARLAAARSAWNQADIRGAAELLLARAGVIAEAGVRTELAEDIAARAAAAAVPLLQRDDIPAHVRAWTCAEAIAVEADLTGRLAARGAADAVAGADAGGDAGRDADAERVAGAAAAAGVTLDPAQAEAAAALAGEHALVLVTGAAGAGKTTTLAAVRAALETGGHQLTVVTPTLKAARGARAETGARTGSAAWLAYQHGWRWDEAGRWTRLAPGQLDPSSGKEYRGPREDARLAPGDLLVVDEAGMLDQDTARALLCVVDEQRARLALVGDRHQLAAVGRGGVLDLAGRWAQRSVTLDVIHRFTATAEIAPGVLADVEDAAYAALSLQIRRGAAGDPAAVFDALTARGQVNVHASAEELRAAVAEQAAGARRAGESAAVCVATNESAGQLNAAVRAQLVTTGDVADDTVATTTGGARIGAGDLIVTRRNDLDVEVANRDTWTVTSVHGDGALTVTPTAGSGLAGQRTLPAGYVRRHVELGYAGTVHGVQGQTAHTGHLVLDEYTNAAAAYVGMTRGRTANTVHLIAADLADARGQWSAAAGRGRVDLGIDAARAAAVRAAAPYADLAGAPSPTDPDRLARVLDQLRATWTEQARAGELLTRLEPRLAHAQADQHRREQAEQRLAPLREQAAASRAAAEHAQARADTAAGLLNQYASQLRSELQAAWDAGRPAAAEAARTVQAGPGRLGWLTGARADVADAGRLLADWAEKWRPVLPELTDAAAAARYAARHPGNDRIQAALGDYAGRRAAHELPQHVHTVHAGRVAAQTAQEAARAYTQAADRVRHDQALRDAVAGYRDQGEQAPRLAAQVEGARDRVQRAEQRLGQLAADPAITAQPDPAGWLQGAHQQWRSDHNAARTAAAQRAARQNARQLAEAARQQPRHHDLPHYGSGRDTGRGGPSRGR